MTDDDPHAQLSDRELGKLAPTHLKNYREDRFRGDSSRSNLSEYADEDRQILIRVYDRLQSVFQELLPEHHDPMHICQILTEQSSQRELIAADIRLLGGATVATNPNHRL